MDFWSLSVWVWCCSGQDQVIKFVSDVSSWFLITFQGWRFHNFSGQPVWPPSLLLFLPDIKLEIFCLLVCVHYISCSCSAPLRTVCLYILYAWLLSKRLKSPLSLFFFRLEKRGSLSLRSVSCAPAHKQLGGPVLDPLSFVSVFIAEWNPNLDNVVQVLSGWYQVEESSRICEPDGCSFSSRAQSAAGLCCKNTLLFSGKGNHLSYFTCFFQDESLVEQNRYKMSCKFLYSYFF